MGKIPEKYVKPDGTLGNVVVRKWGESWWELVSSRIIPFGLYGEEKYDEFDTWAFRIRFTREGWLEQMWERRTKIWYTYEDEDGNELDLMGV